MNRPHRRRRRRYEVIRPKPSLIIQDTPESPEVVPELLQRSRQKERPSYEPTDEDNDLFVKLVEDVFIAADVDYEIEFEHGDYQRAFVNVEGRGAGAWIGRHGASIDALELLLGRMASHQAGHVVPVQIDVNGYREEEEASLREQAQRRAQRVAEGGKDEVFQPMIGRLRRVVHLAAKEIEGIETFTLGHGGEKRVVIRRADADSEASSDE
jgi:spoIIIJ-associated protein